MCVWVYANQIEDLIPMGTHSRSIISGRYPLLYIKGVWVYATQIDDLVKWLHTVKLAYRVDTRYYKLSVCGYMQTKLKI